MLYNLLQEYKSYLLKLEPPRPRATAETYYKRLAALLAAQPAQDTARRLDVQMVLDKLSGIKYKNHFSQSKNAFLQFCAFQNIKLSGDTLAKIKELEDTTKKKHRKLKSIEYNHIDSKIKHLKNMKLKLSYQAMMATGLRVSELAGLMPNDCTVFVDENHPAENSITFSFIGKGRKNGTAVIKASDYPELHGRLKELIENTPTGKKVFYSAIYLQKKATLLGFACHDLRRVFAKLEYQKCRNIAEVSRKLGHSNIRTTSIYLKSRIKLK